MALSRKEKEKLVQNLAQTLREVPAAVFVALQGLSVHELEQIRQNLREQEGRLQVVKKRLLKLALAKAGWEANWDEVEGIFAVAWGRDEISAAKVLDFAGRELEEGKSLNFLGGVLQGEYLLPAQVQALAKLPSLAEQRACLVGLLQGTLRQFLGVLQGVPRQLLLVLQAVSQQKA
jgi:large subunit ribosomal protein L10